MMPSMTRTPLRTLPLARLAMAFALVTSMIAIATQPASAVVNASVRNACMSDYFAYCAGMEVGSSELRRCMSRAGPKLEPACVRALVAAGEVSQGEVNRRSRTAAKAPARSSKVAKASRRAPVAKARAKQMRRQYATLR